MSQDFYLQSADGEYESGFYEVFDAIEIKLISSSDETVEPKQVDWSLRDFDGQVAHIVMDIEAINREAAALESYDNLIMTFNDANGTFMSNSGKPVNFGHKLEWKLAPLVVKEQASRSESLGQLWLSLIYIAVAISFFLAIFQGPLVSTWMMINSLQLIAHLPLVSVRLPANAHYFILNFFDFVRLNFESINSSIQGVSENMSEYKLIEDADSYFSA